MNRCCFLLFYALIPLLCGHLNLFAIDENPSAPVQQAASALPAELPADEPIKKFPFFEEEKKVLPDNDEAFSAAFLNMLGTLVLLVCFMFFASWALKRMLASRSQQLNTSGDIKILEQRSLSHKTGIYIVEIQGKVLALSESPSGVTVLATLKE